VQQREFTANKTIYLSDDDFYIRAADICVHTELTNKLAVYRNQSSVGVFNRSLTSVLSMVAAGWLTETANTPVAAPPAEEAHAEEKAPAEEAHAEEAHAEEAHAEEAHAEEAHAAEEVKAEEPKTAAAKASQKGKKKK
jgi:hypothetical protein